MYCPGCKNKILEGTTTCHFCGQDLSKLRKIKLDDFEEEEEVFHNVNLDRGQIRDALTYDPFKEKVKYHLLASSLVLIFGIGLLIITFFAFGLFTSGFSWLLSIISIILFAIGFVYAIICVILFVK